MPIDAERLRADGFYRAQAPLSELTGDLGDIEMACHRWTGYRTKVRWISTAVLIAGIVFTAGFVEDLWLFRVLGIAMIGAAIWGYVYAYRYARPVITKQNRCGILRKVTETLRDDTHAKSPVTVRMAFAAERSLLAEQEWSLRKKGKQRLYKEDWLSVETRLLDGTTWSENITDLVRERTYVNPRGKSKKKTRVRHVVAMRFAYPADVYGNAAVTGAKLKDAIRLPSTADLKGLQVTDRDIKVKAVVNRTEDLSQASSMLALGVYRILNLARKAKARSGGPGGAQ
jgi:hypothetical protein